MGWGEVDEGTANCVGGRKGGDCCRQALHCLWRLPCTRVEWRCCCFDVVHCAWCCCCGVQLRESGVLCGGELGQPGRRGTQLVYSCTHHVKRRPARPSSVACDVTVNMQPWRMMPLMCSQPGTYACKCVEGSYLTSAQVPVPQLQASYSRHKLLARLKDAQWCWCFWVPPHPISAPCAPCSDASQGALRALGHLWQAPGASQARGMPGSGRVLPHRP